MSHIKMHEAKTVLKIYKTSYRVFLSFLVLNRQKLHQ